MPALNILIGGESFRELREDNFCYVDKTDFIEELFKPGRAKVTLITRPRRFGKTLMMSMLKEFFDINAQDSNLFEGLAISKNKELCHTWMHQYPTLFLSLKDVRGNDFTYACSRMSNLFRDLCIQHSFLLQSDCVDSDDKEAIAILKKGAKAIEEMASALKIICRALESHWRKPAILLIDEYDVPLNNAEQKGYYNDMVELVRDMMAEVLKTNPSLKLAILTGCLRIARESIFTGMNNFVCYGISDHSYSDKFGFTKKEVDELLQRANLEDRKSKIREWYDGYRFGYKEEIYCPWDVLFYIVSVQRDPRALPKTYWINTSGNDIVRRLIDHADQRMRNDIECLISGGIIEKEIAEELTCDVIYKDTKNIWSILYLTGYLTKAKQQPNNKKTALIIPNKEVHELFINTVSQWFEDSLNRQEIQRVVDSFWEGNVDVIQKTLQMILYSTISYFDYAENSYHGFMTGLLRGSGLAIKSNDESGLSRPDILIEDEKNARALIIEVKHCRDFKELDASAKKGLRQIEDFNYTDGLSSPIHKFMKYGIAFCKKECAVQFMESIH